MRYGRVVAGIDGSPAAEAAIRWASAETVARDAELVLLHAFVWPLFKVPLGPSDMAPGLRAGADKIVQDSVELARKFEAGVTVRGVRRDGFPAAVLVGVSSSADLVVIGSRGLGTRLGAMIGSTGLELAANARCPVVVVRPDQGDDPDRAAGPVVIGYDGSEAAATALDFGLDHARRHGVPIRVAVAKQLVVGDGPAEDVRTRVRERAGDLAAEFAPVTGHPADQLLRLSADASLVTLGSRGRGGFAGMILGSVSQTVLHHATCPVAVIPPAAIGG
ncbi:nucleotide-binding universal stress UspA family protein [Kribbella amoyensis]|uniref:Nucleotide-binding universal stress UspA family protein n=1 Tax=Kribbella amoyensis TaxID=996641 RepID=A0A561AZI2_9ACTN|nr:universal stress protein [Kribbella amoyensis]TWD72029.1 nucleotide-binding universal stress UspA family protein [Kribbella amoyensis]